VENWRCTGIQGRRKLLKVGGGQALRGTFGIEKAPRGEKGGGEKVSKFFSGHTKKIVPDIPHFFLNMEKIFRIYQKIFRIHHIFPEMKKIFRKIT
jgi:hypothetical protein